MFRRLVFACATATLMAQAPVITFDKTHHDFGRITPDKKVAAKYRVTNTGNAFLSITQVRPSCGCTYTMLGKWSIAPGESTEIEAMFDPKGLKGGVRKSIEVVCNDPKTPNLSLTLEAEVVQEVMPSVESVYFHQAPKSATTFTYRPEGKDLVLEVSFDGRKVPAGHYRGVEQATVRFTNPRMRQLPLNIQWDLKPSIQASPVELVFQDAAGKELRQKLTLKQAEGRSFRITGTRPSFQGMRVEGLDQKGSTMDLTVVFPPTAKAGRYSEILALTTDDPDQPELTIRVVALLK